MIKYEFKLQFGLEYKGNTYFQAALKPLSIGAELDAMAEIEELPELPESASNAQQTKRQVQETLIYWSKQLEIDGIAAQDLTATFLLNHLSGTDYAQIFDEQDALRAKSPAATATLNTTVAAEPKPETGATLISTTAKQ